MAFQPMKRFVAQSLTRSPLFAEYLSLISDDGEKLSVEEHSPMGPSDALVVIDMQGDFVPQDPTNNPNGGAFGVAEGYHCVAPIVSMIKQGQAVGAEVVATRDYHPYDNASFLTEGGPFPVHCVAGSEGAKLMPEIASAMAEYKAVAPDKVQVAFKGFHEDTDSFGGMPYQSGVVYPDGGDSRVPPLPHRSPGDQDVCPIAGHLTKSPWTGSMLLKCSQCEWAAKKAVKGEGVVTAEDMNCPPDILAFEEDNGDKGARRNRKALHDWLNKKTRLFVCGLALDFCVFDTCMNARALGFENVYIVLDACRAAHIPGAGEFGTGFLSPPDQFLATLEKAGVKLTFTLQVMGGAGLVMPSIAAVANNFPTELSPLGFADVQLKNKAKVPIALKGENEYEVTMVGDLTELKSIGWANAGKCAPKAPLPAGWPGAPPEAKSFCWAYPLAETAGQPKRSAKDMFGFLSLTKSTELNFALRGGFLLLSETGEVLKSQLVVPGDGLSFGAGEPLPQEAATQLKASRMQVATLPHLRKAGATHFCWVNPGEKIGAFSAPALGAYAYLLQDKDPVFFAVKALK